MRPVVGICRALVSTGRRAPANPVGPDPRAGISEVEPGVARIEPLGGDPSLAAYYEVLLGIESVDGSIEPTLFVPVVERLERCVPVCRRIFTLFPPVAKHTYLSSRIAYKLKLIQSESTDWRF